MSEKQFGRFFLYLIFIELYFFHALDDPTGRSPNMS